MPSDKLYPVVLPGNRAVMGLGAFNYIDTSIGTYGEVAAALPAVFEKEITPVNGILPALVEGGYPGLGVVIMHLSVTRVEARGAGHREWGYTKFIADMHFHVSPEYLKCRMLEGNEHILDMRVKRKGIYLRDKKPLRTYSVKNGNLVKTVIPQIAAKRVSLMTGGSHLKLGKHPVADSIRGPGISGRPFMSVYYPERAAVLTSGTIIEKGVRSLEGHPGKDRKAVHSVAYPAGEE